MKSFTILKGAFVNPVSKKCGRRFVYEKRFDPDYRIKNNFLTVLKVLTILSIFGIVKVVELVVWLVILIL